MPVATAVSSRLFNIVHEDNGVFAVCGKGKARLNIVGDSTILNATGSASEFRRVIRVDYETGQDGQIVPLVTDYENVLDYIQRVAMDRFGFRLQKVALMDSEPVATTALSAVLSRVTNQLYTPEVEVETLEEPDGWERRAQGRTVVLAKNTLPRFPGVPWSVMELNRREVFAAYCEELGLSERRFTQVGNPGMSLDTIDSSGYPIHARFNPLLVMRELDNVVRCQVADGRYGVGRGHTHAVRVVGAETEPLVRVAGVEIADYPSHVNLHVVCVPEMGMEDSVILSHSAAKRMTAVKHPLDRARLDDMINSRAGIKFIGRNGMPSSGAFRVVSELGNLAGYEGPHKGHRIVYPQAVPLTEHSPLIASAIRALFPPDSKTSDADVLRNLSEKFRATYSSMITQLGEASPAVSKKLHRFIVESNEWKNHQSAKRQTENVKTWDTAGIERVLLHKLTGDAVLYRSAHDIERKPLRVGAKVQAFGDLFKGVVAQVLPDEAMPIFETADGEKHYADVVCEMGKSTKKHGSLNLAHLQLALYLWADRKGGLKIDHTNPLAMDQLIQTVIDEGLYSDVDLTCDVYSSDGMKVGKWPCGIMPVVRHKQDPDVVGGVIGTLADRRTLLLSRKAKLQAKHDISTGAVCRNMRRCTNRAIRKIDWELTHGKGRVFSASPSRMKSGGVRSGYVDSAVRRAVGLTRCDELLRREDPAASAELEVLRGMVS